MKLFTLRREQFLPISLEKAWGYFSSPANLETITPDKLGFEIISPLPNTMYPGMIIQYFVKPMMNIRIRWVTEITQVQEMSYFVDEQRIGPYRIWHHEHRFKKMEGGVLIEDEINYALPFGLIGRLAHAIWIKSDLNDIFEYRNKKLNTIFNSSTNITQSVA